MSLPTRKLTMQQTQLQELALATRRSVCRRTVHIFVVRGPCDDEFAALSLMRADTRTLYRPCCRRTKDKGALPACCLQPCRVLGGRDRELLGFSLRKEDAVKHQNAGEGHFTVRHTSTGSSTLVTQGHTHKQQPTNQMSKHSSQLY